MRRLLTLLAALVCVAPLTAAEPLELKDGDRVVLIGSTVFEREQQYGYWETALHAAFPAANFTVRNLGWSGDTVFGEARNGFDQSPKGFERLVSLTRELKPTVLFVGYGINESFEGREGLAKFEKGLERLLDAVGSTAARVILFTPFPLEYGNYVRRNEDVKAYAGAIRAVAARRKLTVADVGGEISRRISGTQAASPPLTDNGMHFSELGYRLTADDFLEALGVRPWWGEPEKLTRWRTLDTEPLRKKVVEKNRLFFHRYRPQNETYLYLFRKHEQGNNAAEVPQFDPLIEKAEKEIAALKKALK